MDPNDLFKNIEEVHQRAYKEYNKTENEVNEDIEKIKEWFATQPHLPEIMQDSHIRNFLICNKFSIERTKRKIDMYYTIRSLIPDFYNYSNPKLPAMRKILDSMNICVHPKLNQGLYRVFFYKFKKDNSFKFREAVMTTTNVAEVILHEDCYFNNIHVIDFKNFSVTDLTQITPSAVAKGVAIYGKVFSARFKASYYINAPPYISTVLTIVKKIMKPKLFERVHMYENDEILKSIFTIDTLPKDYGGEGPSLEELTDVMKMKFDKYQDRFDKLDELRVNEDLRPQPLINDEILGFYGNFRKLNVD